MSLEIHKLTETDTFSINFLNELMSELNWAVGEHDIECYTAFGDPGLCIAKLDGKPIGCVSFNKYDDSYWSLGLYVIEKKHRGKGYGMQIFQSAMKQVDFSKNISGYSVPGMIDKYSLYGFKGLWSCPEYEVKAETSLHILRDILQSSTQGYGLVTKSIKDIKEEDLLSYDRAVFGYDRHNFISKMLHSKGSHAKIVVDGDREVIVGYVAARPQFGERSGYILGPLFADSQQAARVLLKALLEDIVNHRGSVPSNAIKVYCFCPVGKNTKSKDLMELIEASRKSEFIYMTTNGVPKGCFDKRFAVASTDI